MKGQKYPNQCNVTGTKCFEDRCHRPGIIGQNHFGAAIGRGLGCVLCAGICPLLRRQFGSPLPTTRLENHCPGPATLGRLVHPKSRSARGMLVCDTDWTVVYIWEQYKYGRSHLSPPLTILPSLYLLCAPDISWQPDPLREHPAERDALFDQYEDLLKYINADYHIMRGDAASRLATALHLVQKYY